MPDFDSVFTMHPLPWTTNAVEEARVVYDANGQMVLVVDQWGDLPDDQVHQMARMVAKAVNTAHHVASAAPRYVEVRS